MSFAIGLGVGFAIGYLVFERPQWATSIIGWIKQKLGIQ